MEMLEFKLRGETAFFKKPEVNSYRYFTYSSIHKVALLGLLGSIVGLGGYGYGQKKDYPEFYERLKSVKCSIEIENPLKQNKKFQQFNNSVGYASNEKGNNLIVTEQWLEKPSWVIRLLLDTIPEDIPLLEFLLNNKAVYIPYLGKNDHFASIGECKVKNIDRIENSKENITIRGLFEENKELFKLSPIRKNFYKYTEYLPVGIDPIMNHYKSSVMTQTNGKLEINAESKEIYEHLFTDENNIYYFF